jgi:hypothetical protein
MQAQPGSALFLASYPTAEHGPLQHAAFLYDNAVAAIALVACGQAAQARRIGDAMLLGLGARSLLARWAPAQRLPGRGGRW